MLKNLSVTAGLIVIGLATFTTPAWADDIWGQVDCSQTSRPGCELAAGMAGHDGWGSGEHDGTDAVLGEGDSVADIPTCRRVPLDYKDPAAEPHAEPGGWFMVLCSPDGKDPNSYGPVWAPAGLGVEPALSPVQVAQVARNRLRLPEVIIGASPAGEQLVNLPTWLWLRSDWQQVSATATVAGASVTATATPISVVWSMGDGATVTCPGPGSTFPTGSTPESASPDCGYTYRSSSAGQRDEAYPVTTTVTWKVAWSGAGQSGVFPNLTVSASTAFRVAESQAINTG